MMEEGIRQKVFPGGVLLCARGTDILFHDAFGLADPSADIKMTRNAMFDLASLTKPMATAVLICILVQEKIICLNTPLGDLIPETRQTPKAKITVDMLLRHTSGLPSYRAFFRTILPCAAFPLKRQVTGSPRQILRNLILSEALEASPGEKQVYSDLGYILLSWIIETRLNQRIDKAAKEKIYRPLGIKNLFFIEFDPFRIGKQLRPDTNGPWVANQACPWRKQIMKGQVDDENAWITGGIEGHAGLFGDAISIHAFCCEILRVMGKNKGIILDPHVFESFAVKHNGQDLVAGFDSPSETRSSSGRYFSSHSLGHLGFTGTSFWIDPESQLIVVLLTNRTHPCRDNQKIKKFRPRIHDCIVSAFR